MRLVGAALADSDPLPELPFPQRRPPEQPFPQRRLLEQSVQEYPSRLAETGYCRSSLPSVAPKPRFTRFLSACPATE